jgi:hypothetical protein
MNLEIFSTKILKQIWRFLLRMQPFVQKTVSWHWLSRKSPIFFAESCRKQSSQHCPQKREKKIVKKLSTLSHFLANRYLQNMSDRRQI